MASVFDMASSSTSWDSAHISSGEHISRDTHPADICVAAMFYNVGLLNSQLLSRRYRSGTKHENLIKDIDAAFGHSSYSIQMLLISEFGGMSKPVENQGFATIEYFNEILQQLSLNHVILEVHGPYVALIDSRVWRIVSSEALGDMCSNAELIVQHLVLEYVDDIARGGGAHPPASNAELLRLRVFNAHMPTSLATKKRKRDCLKHMCVLSAKRDQSIPWMIGGDMNLAPAIMLHACREFLPAKHPSNFGQVGMASRSGCTKG